MQLFFQRQYNTRTFIGSLHPGIKVICSLVVLTSTVITSSSQGLAGIILLCILSLYLSRVRLSAIVSTVVALTPFLLFTFVIHIFLSKGSDFYGLPWGLTVYKAGVYKGLFYSVKIIVIALFGSVLMNASHPAAFSLGLERLLPDFKPVRKFFMLFGFSARFLPGIYQEATRIRTAQIARGLIISGSIKQRVIALVPLVVPLLTMTFYRSEVISSAMQARGFRFGESRSHYIELKMRMADWNTLAIVLCVSIAAIWN